MEFTKHLSSLLNNDFLFWLCALLGSGLLLIQILMSLIGLGDDDLSDGDSDDFRWCSKQSISVFFMMFGWVSLACKREFGLGLFLSIFIAFSVALFTFFILGIIFKMAMKLRSTGTVFNIEKTVGKEAVVYQRITDGGSGKVTVSLDNFTHELEAVSLDGVNIESFTAVKIIKKLNDSTVVVVPIKK